MKVLKFWGRVEVAGTHGQGASLCSQGSVLCVASRLPNWVHSSVNPPPPPGSRDTEKKKYLADELGTIRLPSAKGRPARPGRMTNWGRKRHCNSVEGEGDWLSHTILGRTTMGWHGLAYLEVRF